MNLHVKHSKQQYTGPGWIQNVPVRLLTRSSILALSKSVPDTKAISPLKGVLPEICKNNQIVEKGK